MPKRDPATPDNENSLKAYGRLLRYALHYRGRIAVMVLLSLVVGASLGSVIFTAGTAVNVLFLDDEGFAEQVAEKKSLVLRTADATKRTIQRLPAAIADPLIAWAPNDLPNRVEDL